MLCRLGANAQPHCSVFLQVLTSAFLSSHHSHYLEFPFSSVLRQDLCLSTSGHYLKITLWEDQLSSFGRSIMIKPTLPSQIFQKQCCLYFLCILNSVGQMYQTNSQGVDMFFCLTESLTETRKHCDK